jgi:hypothetical protein
MALPGHEVYHEVCHEVCHEVWLVLVIRYVIRFVCSFVRLFVCSFVRLFVCSFVRLFVCSFVRLFIRSFVCSFIFIPTRKQGREAVDGGGAQTIAVAVVVEFVVGRVGDVDPEPGADREEDLNRGIDPNLGMPQPKVKNTIKSLIKAKHTV